VDRLSRPDGDRTGRPEVAVNGGGAIGAATAYELARQGARVVLPDLDGLASGTSGRNHGFLWLHLRTPGPALALSLASAER
jgi:glycine/D-amino acid oxidase-like deaminating enzyme